MITQQHKGHWLSTRVAETAGFKISHFSSCTSVSGAAPTIFRQHRKPWGCWENNRVLMHLRGLRTCYSIRFVALCSSVHGQGPKQVPENEGLEQGQCCNKWEGNGNSTFGLPFLQRKQFRVQKINKLHRSKLKYTFYLMD